MNREEVAELLSAHHSLKQSHVSLKESHEELSRQLAWFKRQLFGRKSERRICDSEGRQLALGELPAAEEADRPEVEVPAHRRRRRNEGPGRGPPGTVAARGPGAL